MIYALVNSKGGVGKTTNAVHLATMLARFSTTLLIDGDPQASAAAWAAFRRESNTQMPSPTTARLLGKGLLDEGKNLSKGFDNTVIDVGGRDSASLRSSLLLADRAIIPVGASTLDAVAMSDILEVMELAKDYNPKLEAKVLLTRLNPVTRDVDEMVEYLEGEGLSILTSQVCERVAFRRVIGEGAIVQEMTKRQDKKAVQEMEAFFEEVTA